MWSGGELTHIFVKFFTKKFLKKNCIFVLNLFCKIFCVKKFLKNFLLFFFLQKIFTKKILFIFFVKIFYGGV